MFSEAGWNWDEVCRLLILDILAHLVPGLHVWLVLDDTLCHKRGACVAFGGIFLDPVLSTAKRKLFRFGNNWVRSGVWCAYSVPRAHPMSWYVGSLVVLWYTLFGNAEQTPQRHRPWYQHKLAATFAHRLATCRYSLWQHWLAKSASPAELAERQAWLLEYLATAA